MPEVGASGSPPTRASLDSHNRRKCRSLAISLEGISTRRATQPATWSLHTMSLPTPIPPPRKPPPPLPLLRGQGWGWDVRDILGDGAGQGTGSLSFGQRCLGIFLSRPGHRAGIWEAAREWGSAQLGRPHWCTTDLKPSFFIFIFFSNQTPVGTKILKQKQNKQLPS